ncbi:MAG: PilC/PilY family type IV pilus protein [Methylomonas sp.]|jgi:Tfp pilus tip-associated adhesin PilY1
MHVKKLKPLTEITLRLIFIGNIIGATPLAEASTSCATTQFMPVTQCFRTAGAAGWISQFYNNFTLNPTAIPYTAATPSSTGDVSGQGWLRLTNNTGNQSGSAYYNLPVNVTQLGIQAKFTYSSWGWTSSSLGGADGISLFLFDGATTTSQFVQGVFGGGLGYCQQGGNYDSHGNAVSINGYSTAPGLSNAVVGFGIDDWGNFENNNDRCPNYGENGRPDMIPSSGSSYGAIGVRGPGNGQNGYQWLADNIQNNISIGANNPTYYLPLVTPPSGNAPWTRPAASTFYRNVIVNISPATVGSASNYTITGQWQTAQNGAYSQIINAPYPTGLTSSGNTTLPPGSSNGISNSFTNTTGTTWNPLPPTVKFGFAASTGGGTNFHEIQDAYITEGLPDVSITQNTPSVSGSMGRFLVTVTNMGSLPGTSTTANMAFSATISGLTNVVWSCTASIGSTCPAPSGAGAPASAAITLGLAGNVNFIIEGQVNGSSISDSVSLANGSGYTDKCPDNNDASSNCPLCAASLTVGSSSSNSLSLSQQPQATDSAGANTVSGGQVQTSNQVYLTKYNQANWWGELLAYNLTATGSGATAKLTGTASTANWDASCNLTGGVCANVTNTPTVTAMTPSSRTILTWNGSKGVPLEWNSSPTTSTLTSAQQNALGADTILSGASFAGSSYSGGNKGGNVVNFLRGDRTYEQDNITNVSVPGPFRTRTGILGDIVDSGPVWVGPPAAYPASTAWTDLLYSTSMPENGGGTSNSYVTYASNNASRTNVVFVGSNDGMVHGFSAGSYSNGSFNTSSSTNTGAELLAYMPSTVLSEIGVDTSSALNAVYPNNYNFTDPAYTHRYFVDATPAAADLYYNSAWHTWLVGGLGGGGAAIYALDITTPGNFSESNASSLVVNELNTSNIVCSNNATCALDLGWTYGTPIIQRMHNGAWAVIFGNGFNSANEKASIFIASINPTTAAWTVYELKTNSQTPNGIAYVSPADLDNDNVVDYLYAGDLFGNIWRFDVTSNSPSNWITSKYGQTSASPLFTAQNAGGWPQPVTTSVQAIKTQQSGNSRVVIMFGTGKNLEASDLLPDNTANGVQSIYSIWDYDLAAWNSLSTTGYLTQTAPQTISRANLQQQTITGTSDSSGNTLLPYSSTAYYRTLSNNAICWQGSTICTSNSTQNSNTQFGAYLDLDPGNNTVGEQVIYNPIQYQGIFFVNTTIPSSQTQGLTCTAADPPGGWLMALNPLNDGAYETGAFPNTPFNTTAGVNMGSQGSPSVISFNNQSYLLTRTIGGLGVQQFNPPCVSNCVNGPGTGSRVNWIQLR